MSIKGNNTKSIRKQALVNTRNPVVGTKSIKFYHQAIAGQTIIDITNLTGPTGFINPSPVELSKVMLKTFQSNFSIYNGTGNNLVENLGYDVITETTIKLKVPALAGEIFKGHLSSYTVNGTVIADVRTPGSTGILLEGQFSFNLGEAIQIKDLNNQKPIIVERSTNNIPRQMYRHTLNGTTGGNYQMIDRGDGYCQEIVFDIAGNVGGETIAWSSLGAVAERADLSTLQHVDKLNGIVDTMRGDLLKATGNNILDPTRYDNGVPTNSDLRSFGDKVFNIEQQINLPREIGAVGDIKSSVLTEGQFQIVHGTGWILADGRSVIGSTYETITGNTLIPDARGVALRGKNNGRVDGSQNPDGELALGVFQDQATAKNNLTASTSGSTNTTGNHTHNVTYVTGSIGGSVPKSTDAGTAYNIATGAAGNHSHTVTATTTITGGANETRMKNITVNFFIKIN